MARVFVYSENLTSRVEIETDPVDGTRRAFCLGCTNGRRTAAADLLDGTSDSCTMEDAIEAAGHHADCCKRCAEQLCRTPGIHDAGYRCRKDY